MWAVLEVDQDYDCVNGIECICTVSTEENGFAYIKEAEKQNTANFLTREKYVDDYVNSLDEDVLKKLKKKAEFKHLDQKVAPFKDCFKLFLKNNHYKIELENYNPPEFKWVGNLFVVEIKN